MAEDKKAPDLLKGPVELAAAQFSAELENFEGRLAQPDATREWLRERHIRLKDLRGE